MKDQKLEKIQELVKQVRSDMNKLSDIEWDDFEVKAAKNELPKNIWETNHPQRISRL